MRVHLNLQILDFYFFKYFKVMLFHFTRKQSILAKIKEVPLPIPSKHTYLCLPTFQITNYKFQTS